MKNVLITGISGQDGIFLTSKLLNKGKYRIYGVARSSEEKFIKKLSTLNHKNFENLKLGNVDLCNQKLVGSMLDEIKPNIIFNLSGPSSVYNSFNDNNLSKNTMIKIFDNLISSSFKLDHFPKFFQASSSEMYGLNNKEMLSENDEFIPNSPYAEGKHHIHKKIIEINQNKGLDIKSGIMFNHESEFRTDDYLFMKIINFALNAEKGQILEIGSLKYIRDWSFAGDVVDAMYDITLHGNSEIYCIGSGIGNTIEELVSIIFEKYNLNYMEYIQENKHLLRKNDPHKRICNPKKINDEFGWVPSISFEELIYRCINKKII